MATVPGIEKIGIVGVGNMGHQIALCAAIAGYRVYCTDVSRDALSKAGQFTQSYLTGPVTKGKLTEELPRRCVAELPLSPHWRK